MAEVELNLQQLTIPELLATAHGISAALRGNEHFTDPEPSPDELDRLTAALSAANEEYARQKAAAALAKARREDAADTLRKALAREADYVQETSGGSITKILSANLHVEEETSFWPFGRLSPVEDLSASSGDESGEVDLAWEPIAGAHGYEVEIAYDLLGEGPWEQIGATNKSKLTIGKLTPRVRVWFRVRAVNDSGPGDWSDPVQKTIS